MTWYIRILVSSPRGSKTVEPCDEGARSPTPATASDIATDAAGDAGGGGAAGAVTQGTIEVRSDDVDDRGSLKQLFMKFIDKLTLFAMVALMSRIVHDSQSF